MPASLFVDPTLLTMSTTHKFPSQLAGEGELGTVHGALVSDQGTAAARFIAGKGKLLSSLAKTRVAFNPVQGRSK